MTGFDPTPEQQAAITAPLGPLLLVAGAGTGKTTVMAQRILHLVTTGACRADQVLGLTFTNKAAFNLKEKVRAVLGADADVTIATYHSYGARLVTDHALELGLHPDTQLLDRAQAWQLLYTVFDEFRFERRSALMPGIVLDAALTLASRAADYLVPIAAVAADCDRVAASTPSKNVRATALARRELCQVVAAYERRKRERHLLDYGDQVALAVRLFEDHPEVAAAERERHPVVLLDEYQDTNYAQRRLLQLVHPPGSAVTAVGDDMQSIYAFRGAHLFNILHFGEHFGAERRQDLQVTFRFGEPLATVANRIQAQVGDALNKVLRPAGSGGESTVECFLAADDAEEAATIAADVAARVGRGDARYGDHAVLCRKRRLIPAITEAMAAQGVPVEVVGASGLLARPEVVDLVAWIEVLADPAASIALLRILRGPRYNIGLRDLAALARHPGGLATSLASADGLDGVADLSDAARARLDAYRTERAELAAVAARVPLLDVAETIVLRTGLWKAAGPVGRENLLRFLDLAERFTPLEGEPGLTAFVEYLQLLEEAEEDVAEAHNRPAWPQRRDRDGPDAVRVMTVHQAKGLEFPVVYVPGLAGKGSSRIFPDERSHENALTNASALPWWLRADDEGIPDPDSATQTAIADAIRRRRRDEEWRLLYVACTRAQRHLVCSAAHWYPGPAEPRGPSEFYDFVAGLAADGLVVERFRHEPAAVDPEVAAKQRHLAAQARRYAASVASDPAQLTLADVAVSPASTAPARSAPTALSVTGLVSYARCPKQFFWTVVRPLPRRSSASARLGTEVHRWIEQRAGRQLSLIDVEPEDDDDPDRSQPGIAAALKESFLASPWADLDPERVEAPFILAVGHHLVRGRIDAVYRRDGRLELVDYKTGRPAPMGDRPATLQLNLYGLAAVDTWGADPARLRTTYCYLRAGEPPALLSADWDPAAVDQVRADLADTLDQIAARRFEPAPGRWCRGCDFLAACGPGRQEVGG